MNIVKEYHLEERVSFIGSRDDIFAVMKESDIILVPSLCDEAFGLVAVEPMTIGKPVVVSNRGALPQIVDFGKAGKIFDPEDLQQFAEAIISITAQSDATIQMIERAHKLASEVFSYQRWAREVSNCLLAAVKQ